MFLLLGLLRKLVVPVVLLIGLIQLVPYGRAHSNPAPTKTARFTSAAARQIVANACADCHSYRTTWPWYTNVAPVSWLVQNDVDGGRRALNFSRWDTAQPALAVVVDKVSSDEMPPLKYKLMPNHAKARLSDAEKRRLIAGLRQLYAADPPASIRRGRRE